MTRPRIAQIPETTIKFSITDSDTTIVLSSLKDSRGTLVAMATAFVPIGFATLAPKGAKEEIISFTGITQNTDGSATLTGVTRNLAPVYPYTTLGSGDGHGAGTIVSFSNNPQLYGLFADYIEEIGVSGAPNASVTTKGIVEVATIQEINDDDETGATGATLSIDPSRLHQSKYGQQLPTADEKAGIAGLSATNKPIQNDSVTSNGKGGTLGEQTTSTNTIEFGRVNATGQKNKLAQRFTPTKTKMRGIELWKKANTGTYTGNVTITLQADNVGNPSGTPLATRVITSAVFNALADNAAFENLFASEYTSLVVGGLYWIVIESSTSDNSNHGNLGGRTSGGSGNVKYWNTTDGWVSVANADLYYKVMEGNTNQVVRTNEDGIVVNSATRRIEYTTQTSTEIGSSTSQYTTSNISGTTWRYTWTGVGTNPNINSSSVPVGTLVFLDGGDVKNRDFYIVTNSGTNWFEVTNPDAIVQTFTSQVFIRLPYTWTKSSGLKKIKVEMWGGGGAGDTTSGSFIVNHGGGGGAYNVKEFLESELNATEIVTVAAGATTSGRSGGHSTFGFKMFAYGGGGGRASTGSGVGYRAGGGGQLSKGKNAGIAADTGSIPQTMGTPIFPVTGGEVAGATTGNMNATFGGGGSGGSSMYGGAGGGGGLSVFGGNGGAFSTGNNNAGHGEVPAGGGGNRTGSGTGLFGNGGNGIVIITEYFN